MTKALAKLPTKTVTVAQANVTVSKIDDKVVLKHAGLIKGAWQKAVGSIIEAGQLLIKAKEALPRGRFTKIFEVDQFPFGERTAQQLMKIARHSVLSKPKHASVLPPHWDTLAILSRAPPKKLEAWLADGTVNAETERAKAEALVSPPADMRITHEPVENSHVIMRIQKPVEEVKRVGIASDEVKRGGFAKPVDSPSQVFDVELRQCLRQLHELICESTKIDRTRVIEGVGLDKIRDIFEELKSWLDENPAAESREKTTLN